MPASNAADMRFIEQNLVQFCGYKQEHVYRNYRYSAFGKSDVTPSTVPLAAFGQDPPSASSACLGIVNADNPPEDIRFLGAPIIICVTGNVGRRWRIAADGVTLQDQQPILLDKLFQKHKAEWAPDRILAAKTVSGARQLDFVDIGLLPAIEHEACQKLDALIGSVLTTAISDYEKASCDVPIPYESLYLMLFRLITGKALIDMQVFSSIDNSSPWNIVREVERYTSAPALRNIPDLVLENATSSIMGGFPFYNLSVNTLAYVYENTLVSQEIRRQHSIHLTPPHLASYMMEHCPIESLGCDHLRVLDPMCGGGTFLVAAMQRMRRTLPADWSPAERHKYFVNRITGTDLSPFAVEVAKCALTLADLPNPDGWNIYRQDAYAPNSLETLSREATLFVTNPPFELFAAAERKTRGYLATKPAEMLLRSIPYIPNGGLLALVLPVAFLDGQSYGTVRRLFTQSCELIEVLKLPDKVFARADAEVALVIARRVESVNRSVHVKYGSVKESDYQLFANSGQVTRADSYQHGAVLDRFQRSESLWMPSHLTIWNSLDNCPKLSSVLDIHKGVEYHSMNSDKGPVVTDKKTPGRILGFGEVDKVSLCPFAIKKNQWLDARKKLRRGGAWDYAWTAPKIIANVAPRQRGPWPLTAAVDDKGGTASVRFFAMWQKDNRWSLWSICAILNSALANAFIRDHDGKRFIRVCTLNNLPMPAYDYDLVEQLDSLAHQAGVAQDDAELTRLLKLIDSVLLDAYNLSPKCQRQILDLFWGEERPCVSRFNGYFPPDFEPIIPLSLFLSGSLEKYNGAALCQQAEKTTNDDVATFFHWLLGEDAQ